MLDVINSFKRTNIMAVEDDLAFEFVPILLDVVMLDHDDHHIHFAEELIEIENLIGYNFFVGEEGVETLQWSGEVALLNVNHLQGGTFADIVDILLVGDAIETNSSVVSNMMLLHNLMDAL